MSGASWALDPINTSELVNAVTADKIRAHLQALQAIANDSGGTRALGTPGYSRSGNYVARRLVGAGYDVRVQPFVANFYTELSPPSLVRTAPTREVHPAGTMEFAGAGNVRAPLALAGGIIIPPTSEPSSDSGCDASDFPASVSGKVVLVQRGTCTFFQKAENARAAGATAVVIFNEGNPGRTDLLTGTLGDKVAIPVVGTSFAAGKELYDLVKSGAAVEVEVKVDATTTTKDTFNVIGTKLGRRSTHIAMSGAHLDSVAEGPGINDNGSGTAALLVIAEEMSRLGIQPRNTVRFAFWGAEEVGLIGSDFYVNSLTQSQLDNIGVYLNFDMVGSPNFARFVYDGDGDIGPAGPPGSDVIEEVFTDFFTSRTLFSEPTEFDGRSDYQPSSRTAFLRVGCSPALRGSRRRHRPGSTAAVPDWLTTAAITKLVIRLRM
jgi:Zn-dependent M28 family amino/carboxypeptidase